ncbi:MAG: hypothetical protein AAF682_14490 [Planctomycetota bacterium]
MRRALSLLTLLLAACSSAPSNTEVLDPRALDGDLVIGVAPVAVPDELEPLRGAADGLAAELVTRLTASGRVARLVNEGAATAVDAVLYPRLRVREASFTGSSASWDGTWQPIQEYVKGTGPGTPTGRARFRFAGTIPALSLELVLAARGEPLYRGRGGIHTLYTRRGPDLNAVPLGEVLADSERNDAALRLALGPLLEPTDG